MKKIDKKLAQNPYNDWIYATFCKNRPTAHQYSCGFRRFCIQFCAGVCQIFRPRRNAPQKPAPRLGMKGIEICGEEGKQWRKRELVELLNR